MESEIEDKIAYSLLELAKDVKQANKKELQHILVFVHKIRLDIESGRYDTETKKWSEINWRER